MMDGSDTNTNTNTTTSLLPSFDSKEMDGIERNNNKM
jgi:hypothetical protein